MKKQWLVALTVLGAVLAAPVSLWSSTQVTHAVFAGADIGNTAGPLTHIWIGTGLSCQVAHTDDTDYEMYPPGDQEGDCSTVVLVNGTTYGYSGFAGTDFTPVSQSAVTGDGSSGTPFSVTTIVDADAEGIRVNETDSYIIGNEFYRTDVQVANTNDTGAASTVRVYRGADCYLGGSDQGYGYADPIGKVVACTENPNNSPLGRIEEWTPITPADHYYEAHWSTVENAADSGTQLPDTCICSTLDDNGAAISWDRTIGAGQSTTLSHYTTFSPLGAGAPTPTPSGETATATPTSTATPISTATPTLTPVGPLKTHTPTATPTSEPSSTPTPVTPTNTAAAPSATVEPTGGRGGVITGPDTGSGPTGGSSRSTLLFGAAMLAVAGAFAAAVGRKVRR